MVTKFQVKKGIRGAQVQIVRSGHLVKVDLDTATDKQLKELYELNHPWVTKIPEPEKAKKEAK